jgi:hypothetical protein
LGIHRVDGEHRAIGRGRRNAALTGFVVTLTVLVVQMATGTFSARCMRLWYRDRMLKALLTLLVGTLTFAFGLLRRIGSDFVPNIGVTVIGVLLVACLLLFLTFLDPFLPSPPASCSRHARRRLFSVISNGVRLRWPRRPRLFRGTTREVAAKPTPDRSQCQIRHDPGCRRSWAARLGTRTRVFRRRAPGDRRSRPG